MNSLPEELIVQIASHVGCAPFLANLTLTSKQLNRICSPILYRHLTIHADGLGPAGCLRAITGHLLERPDLAACVDTLSISPSQLSEQIKRSPPSFAQLDPALLEAIEHASTTQEDCKRWAIDLADPYRDDAVLALLICSLPNLKRLELQLPESPSERWEKMLSKYERLSRRPQIEHMVLKSGCSQDLRQWRTQSDRNDAQPSYQDSANLDASQGELHWDSLNAFDELSNVIGYLDVDNFFYPKGPWIPCSTILQYMKCFLPKTLRIYRAAQDLPLEHFEPVYTLLRNLQQEVRIRAEGRSASYPVDHLELRRANFGASVLWRLLSACRSLTTFILEFESYKMAAQIVVDLLMLHKDTLKCLYLDVTDGCFNEPLEGLQAFMGLQHLKTHSTLLIHMGLSWPSDKEASDDLVDRLPPNITHLTLTKAYLAHDRIFFAVSKYVGLWKIATPHLQRIGIEDINPDSSFFDQFQDCAKVAEDSGLRLDISH
ncbi:hypothetical protein CC78DRAFT_187877 [Lojkania enalia]|uniref:F-box domain-containing protein n=1 Tax=Lojkania enalia TaxID=147567 RepID=A0A9P4NB91_9PLEO|nr:hypothetical protein CC78DRAFT_187877 [Didymosphaeria enalia]